MELIYSKEDQAVFDRLREQIKDREEYLVSICEGQPELLRRYFAEDGILAGLTRALVRLHQVSIPEAFKTNLATPERI